MNCDFIAPWYRWLEYAAFGRALQQRRVEYLEAVAQARRVLIVGDGDGRFTAEFLKRSRAASVVCLDGSAGMTHLAERRIGKLKGLDRTRVTLLVADARTVELGGEYDLIVSHFFLDCLMTDELDLVVARLSEVAGAGAAWLVSEFRIPEEAGPRRWAARFVIEALYLGFGVLTGLKTRQLPDYAEALRRVGFERQRQQTAVGGLLVSELWQRKSVPSGELVIGRKDR